MVNDRRLYASAAIVDSLELVVTRAREKRPSRRGCKQYQTHSSLFPTSDTTPHFLAVNIQEDAAIVGAWSMRGLAFPPDAALDRETSYEYGTPVSHVDDIPIDPLLSSSAIDPTLMPEKQEVTSIVTQSIIQNSEQDINEYSRVRQYSQGPQGDPFAPQPNEAFLPVELAHDAPPPKPVKRRRKVHREEECSFCQGNDAKNKAGESEQMVTCSECGRSGHPSCMQLSEIGEHMRSYPWKCMECKNCEICHEKGDDERILFCDWCDRGWHLDCMNPPMEAAPEGKWHCPMCPPLFPEGPMYHHLLDTEPIEIPSPSAQTIRASSVASSFHGGPENPNSGPITRRKGPIKSKGRTHMPTNTDDSDPGEFDGDEVEAVITTRRKARTVKKPKGRSEGTLREDREEPEGKETLSPHRPQKRKRTREHSPTPLPRVRLRLPPQKGKGREREDDELPSGLFDDILSVEDRDTSKTTITNSDKQHFEKSRLVAEEKLTPLQPPPKPVPRPAVALDISNPGPSRPLRSLTLQQVAAPTITPAGASASPVPSTPGPFIKTDLATLRIRTIRFGPYDIKTWYDAPFPEEYASIPDGRLWICEFCLKYMKSRFGAVRHRMKCKARHPPGDEIYRDGNISIFEVDGRRNKIYCQNLCLLSKMFLDHKSLFYDVEPFLFYVITEVDEFGARFVGYFSKEKRSPKDYNVSCIMTLPVRQRQGWGNLLIDFSYLLSKKEQRAGSPEKPLSSLGALGYKNYWTLSIMRYLETAPDNVKLEDISSATSLTLEDICETLIQQSMIYIRDETPPIIKPSPGQSIKFPKGRKNGIPRRQLHRMQSSDKDPDASKGPFIPPKHYEIRWDRDKVDSYLRTWEAKGYLKLKPEKLRWTPYLMSRGKDDVNVKDPVELPTTAVISESDETPSHTNAADLEDAVVDMLPVLGNNEIEESLVPFTPRETRSGTRSQPKKPAGNEEDAPENMTMRRLRDRSRAGSQLSTPKRTTPAQEEPRRSSVRLNRTFSRKDNVDTNDIRIPTPVTEDQKQGSHYLRTRANGLQSENKAMTRASSSPSLTPARKRRRIESSPELEESSPKTALPLTSKHKPANGVHTNCAVDSNMRLESDAGSLEAHKQPLPPEDSKAEDVGSKTISSNELRVEEVPAFIHDVKSEDVCTPLTSITSRQSLPSDDTVFNGEIVHVNTHHEKHPNGINGLAESDLRSTLAPVSLGKEVKNIAQPLDDEEGDADADGEYEEDADGEPDVELLGEEGR